MIRSPAVSSSHQKIQQFTIKFTSYCFFLSVKCLHPNKYNVYSRSHYLSNLNFYDSLRTLGSGSPVLTKVVYHNCTNFPFRFFLQGLRIRESIYVNLCFDLDLTFREKKRIRVRALYKTRSGSELFHNADPDPHTLVSM